MDFKTMPPCRSVLHNKVKRANFIAHMVKTCCNNTIIFDTPDKHGWVFNDNQFIVDYIDGLQFPENLVYEATSMLGENDTEDNEDEQYSDTCQSDIVLSDSDDDF